MSSITVQVFDPAMCCSTGVCGPSIDTNLIRFASALTWLAQQGVLVERANLGQDFAAFAACPAVVAEINRDANVLPLVLVNGIVKSRKTYPTREELAEWCQLPAPPVLKSLASLVMSGNG